MKYLTKTRFNAARECVTKLRYFDNPSYENAISQSDFMKALADGGHQVGGLAKSMFSDGIEVTDSGHENQLEATSELLSRENVEIFEAAVSAGRLFVRVDVLQKVGNRLILNEVKAKGFSSSNDVPNGIVGAKGKILSEFKKYLYDAAFQRHVLRLAYPTLEISTNLILPDKDKVCTHAGLHERLRLERKDNHVTVDVDASLLNGLAAGEILTTLPIDSYLDILVKEPLEVMGKELDFVSAIEVFSQELDSSSPAFVGSHCRNCEFQNTSNGSNRSLLDGRVTCWSERFSVSSSEVSSAAIYDIYALSAKRTNEIAQSGRYSMRQLSSEDVGLKEEAERISQSHRQWLQCSEANGLLTGPFLRHQLGDELSKLKYPLHFIDFETARSPIPYHAGKRPYELVLFQYSHHVVYADGTTRHAGQYLNTERGFFPSFDLIRSLRNELSSDEGSVLHWWDYEKSVLKEVKRQLGLTKQEEVSDRDELIFFIDSLLESGRLKDLGRMAHDNIYLRGAKGSSSIKLLLPALISESEQLFDKYKEPIYGAEDGISSSNFTRTIWCSRDPTGAVVDPYSLLGQLLDDPDLAIDSEAREELLVENGGAAMLAYGLTQGANLDSVDLSSIRKQLLRYCELDTMAMVMAWEGLQDLSGNH